MASSPAGGPGPARPLSPGISPQPWHTLQGSGRRTGGPGCQQVSAARSPPPFDVPLAAPASLNPGDWEHEPCQVGKPWALEEGEGWHRSLEIAKPDWPSPEPPALADPALSRGVGSGRLRLIPSSSPAPALCRDNTPSQAARELPLQSCSMAHVKRLLFFSVQCQTSRKEWCRQSPSPRGQRGKGMLRCTPSPEEAASLPSRGRGSRNSGERMEPAGPCLASAFWPGKHSRSRELLPTRKKRKGWAKGPWRRAALQAQQAAASSAAGCQPRGWHFGRGLGRPFGEAEMEAAGSTAACWT